MLCIALFLPQLAGALEARPLSPSVVLVLKLVSTTHVKPTTGIVISDAGLVLVSADFVLSEGEIIVMDGGTDIVKNGRPASVVQRSESGGLAVLSVKGLKRPGIILSENTPPMDAEFQLSAFPPAEYIAKGAPPLWAPVKILQGDGNAKLSISPATPLPYVSGAILDTCGYLTGISLATGTQSLQPGNIPLTIFADELKSALDSMLVKLPMAKCDKQAQQPVLPGSGEQKTAASGSKKQAPKSSDSSLIKPQVYRPVITRKRLNPFQGAFPRPDIPENAEPPSLWQSIPFWLPLLVIIGLAALIWKGFFFFRHSRNVKRQTSTSPPVPISQGASAEPDTAPLLEAATVRPRSAPQDEPELPDVNALPDACNGVLVIECLIDAEIRFKRFCVVNTEQINIVIGRGNTAISIEHPVISREHARLQSDGEHMTLSDLGSSWGTFINGVPCLPGEVMFVAIGDEIFLGDVQLHISIIRKEAGSS